MPRLNRRPKRQARGLPEERILYHALASDRYLIDRPRIEGPRPADEELLAAWQESEVEMIEWWLESLDPSINLPLWRFACCQEAKPGTRPPSWWRLMAPEPRRKGETQCQYLTRLDLLTELEKLMLS